MIEKTIEKKWADNRQRLLQEDEEYQRILRSYRKHNWADALVAPAALIGYARHELILMGASP